MTAHQRLPFVANPSEVVRVRLIDHGEKVGSWDILALDAPSGFGKTTFLHELLSSNAFNSHKVIFVDLQSVRDAPAVEAKLFVEGVENSGLPTDRRFLSLLPLENEVDLVEFYAKLSQSVQSSSAPVVLTVDGIDERLSASTEEFVKHLCASSSEKLKIILSGRSLAEYCKSGIKLAKRLEHWTADKMRFDEEETRLLLGELAESGGGGNTTTKLHQKTEGWPAALQLARHALQSTQEPSEFVDHFSGDDRAVAEYLTTTVFERLTEEVRQFLVQTSMFEELHAEFCNFALEIKNSKEILQRLSDRNVFLFGVEQKSGWFRYHELFRSFLESQAADLDRSVFNESMLRGAEWLANSGDSIAALRLYLMAGEMDLASQLVEGHARSLIERGEMPELSRLIRTLPVSVTSRNPQLIILQCWALIHMHQPVAARESLLRAMTFVETLDANDLIERSTVLPRLKQELEVLRAGIRLAEDETVECEKVTRSLLEAGSLSDEFLRGAAYNFHSYACYANGRIGEARSASDAAAYLTQSSGVLFGQAYSAVFMAMTEMASGHFGHARERLEHFLSSNQYSQGSLIDQPVQVLKARIAYLGGDQEEPARVFEECIPSLRRCGHPDLLLMSLASQIHLVHRNEGLGAALNTVDEALAIATDLGIDRAALAIDYEHIRLLLQYSDIEGAVRIAARHRIFPEDGLESRVGHWDRLTYHRDMIRGRLLFAQGDLAQAIDLFSQISKIAAHAGMFYNVACAQLLEADALAKSAPATDQIDYFQHALASISEWQVPALVLEEGDRFVDFVLERQSLMKSPRVKGLLKTLTRLRSGTTAQREEVRSGSARAAISDAILLEPLSARELEVLALLARGRSNRAISHELRLSANTVKWHLKNIFEKLAVNNRTAAVLAAQSLDLL